MNHSEVNKHLADYLEGDIDLGVRALVDAHLDDCAECAQEVTEMQQTIRLLRMLPEPEQPPMVAANVMRRVRAGETEPGFFERIGRVIGGLLEPTFVVPASAVAAAAFVVVIVQEPGGLSGLLNDPTGRGAGGLTLEQAAAVPFSIPSTGSATGPSNGNTLNPVQGTVTITAQGSRQRSYGAPAAQDFLSASSASRTPRVYSDVGIGSGLRNARSESSAQTRGRFSNSLNSVLNSARNGATRTETRVRTRIQVDHKGRPIATVVERSQAGGARALAPSSPFPTRANVLAGGAVPVAGSAAGMNARSSGLTARGLVPLARGADAAAAGVSDSSSGGEDVRDLWLARGLEDPVGLANFIAERNLAEQELWVSRLSERASERGVLDNLLTALRASGDETAVWVADDFAAERER